MATRKQSGSKSGAYGGRSGVGGTAREMKGQRVSEPLPDHLKGKYGKVQKLPPKKK